VAEPSASWRASGEFEAGQVTAITGAAAGIGRALTLRLAQAGVAIAAADLDQDGLHAVAAQVQAQGGRIETTVVDVRSAEQVNTWAQQTTARFGAVHAIWNVAGIINAGTVLDSTIEDIDAVMAVDFWGVVHATKAFLPLIIDSGGGRVVNVSSAFGLISAPGYGSYNAAKFAVRGWSDALRQELRHTTPPVQVTCVYPGGIRTPIMTRATSAAGPDDAARRRALFDTRVARTDVDTAADTILRGVAAGRPRVLVGPDAYLADALARITAPGYEPLPALATGYRHLKQAITRRFSTAQE